MNRIKELRIEAGMKQAELARQLSVARTTVSNYELEIHSFDINVIARLCEIFGVTSDYLLGFSTQRRAQVSEEDAALVAAYHAAPPEIRSIVDTALKNYKEGKKAAVG